MTSLRVYLYDRLVGRLVHQEGGSVFYPDSNWDRQRFLLGLSWILSAETGERRANTGLPEWFENLLPEPEGELRERLARTIGIKSTSSFSLLSGLGRDLPGAVVVIPEGEAQEEPPESREKKSKLRFSLAGVQLKFSVSVRNQRICLPISGEDGRWILKLPTGNIDDIPVVEAAVMTWAAQAGFEVPEHRVVPIAQLDEFESLSLNIDETGFLIRRFDRSDTGRVHQEDFAQIYGVLPKHKYSDDGWKKTSYDAMGRLVWDACGENTFWEYVRRLVFMAASGNTDAHLKNWSLQYAPGQPPRLCPLYDQVSVIFWEHRFGWKAPTPPTLALGIGGKRTLDDLDIHRFNRLSARVGVTEAEMHRHIRDALLDIYHAFESLDLPEKLHQILSDHRQKVPLLRAV